MDGVNGAGKGKRKYYVGESGVPVWRKGMEVDNFMLDGMGAPYLHRSGLGARDAR